MSSTALVTHGGYTTSLLPTGLNLRRWLPLLLVLLVALALRLALWHSLPREGLISDEAEYLAAANWLAAGRGFAWHQGWLWTRAPLYPLFLAAHMRLFGFSLAPIYASQLVLSLLNVVLVYALASQVSGGRARPMPALAALLAALYLPFASYPQMILSETLYMTLLLAAFAALGQWSQAAARQSRRALLLVALAGVLLGMAALTRGLTLGFLPLVALWLLLHAGRAASQGFWRSLPRRLVPAAVLTLVCACTILPWSLYASRAYGGPVLIDTTGAFNLLLGARTAYDGGRSDAPTRNFILALLDEQLSQPQRRALLANDEHAACLWQQADPRLLTALETPPGAISQAERQRLMTAEALCLLSQTPGAFLGKSAREFIDLFQINYTGAERMSGGFTQGRLPRWYVLALFVLDDTLYVLLLPLALIGWARAYQQPPAAALTTLVGLWWLYNLLTAPLLFAINRFRIPLLPFACIYAAAALLPHLFAAPRRAVLRVASLAAALLFLVATTPYAYLQEPPSEWASYLGPYPSSLQATVMAWNARPEYLHEQQVINALGAGQPQAARRLIDQHDLSTCDTCTLRLAPPLLHGLEGVPAAGLALLPTWRVISATKDWRASVVRGDLLRRLQDWDGARAAFTPGYVDDQNPVAWGWRWLHPAPTRHIDLGGNLDIGYIQGFYLGEGDTTPEGSGTFRWSAGQARLLFPQQGRASPQRLCVRADGRGWPGDLAMPTIALQMEQPAQAPIPLADIALQRDVRVYCAEVPPTAPGADISIRLHTPTFVPEAADLLAQQGPQAGQLRLLGVRLDWATLE